MNLNKQLANSIKDDTVRKSVIDATIRAKELFKSLEANPKYNELKEKFIKKYQLALVRFNHKSKHRLKKRINQKHKLKG